MIRGPGRAALHIFRRSSIGSLGKRVNSSNETPERSIFTNACISVTDPWTEEIEPCWDSVGAWESWNTVKTLLQKLWYLSIIPAVSMIYLTTKGCSLAKYLRVGRVTKDRAEGLKTTGWIFYCLVNMKYWLLHHLPSLWCSSYQLPIWAATNSLCKRSCSTTLPRIAKHQPRLRQRFFSYLCKRAAKIALPTS